MLMSYNNVNIRILVYSYHKEAQPKAITYHQNGILLKYDHHVTAHFQTFKGVQQGGTRGPLLL